MVERVGECSGVGWDWRCFRNSAVALGVKVVVVEVVSFLREREEGEKGLKVLEN